MLPILCRALPLKIHQLRLPQGKAFARCDRSQSALLNQIEGPRQAALDAGDPAVGVSDLIFETLSAQAFLEFGAEMLNTLSGKDTFEHRLNNLE